MVNVAVLMGRLVADPELKHTPNNIAVTRFTIAVNRNYAKTPEDRKSDFIDIVAWRSNAEFVCKYFKKGNLIAVDGSIQTGSYEDREGIKRRKFEVIANNINFVESKKEAEQSAARSAANSDVSDKSTSSFEEFSSGTNDDFQTIESDEDLPF